MQVEPRRSKVLCNVWPSIAIYLALRSRPAPSTVLVIKTLWRFLAAFLRTFLGLRYVERVTQKTHLKKKCIFLVKNISPNSVATLWGSYGESSVSGGQNLRLRETTKRILAGVLFLRRATKIIRRSKFAFCLRETGVGFVGVCRGVVCVTDLCRRSFFLVFAEGVNV